MYRIRHMIFDRFTWLVFKLVSSSYPRIRLVDFVAIGTLV